MSNSYVNLKINGKMFPTWIMANFKKFKLPEILQGTDPCNDAHSDALRKYQTFISAFIDNNSIYKDILIYHGLGSGKTATIINLYNVLYNANENTNVILLIRASLHDNPWVAELTKWIQKDGFESRMKNVHFVHYDSPYADTTFMEEMKKIDTRNKNLFIVDEAHNFIKNVHSNISNQQGKKAQIIYNMIIKEKLNKPETRVVCMSATPAINVPYELALMFNLLRPNIFPSNELEFNTIFVQSGAIPTINESTKNTFQRRIMGLVSYYVGATPDYFAKQVNHEINIEMNDYHQKVYEYYEELEKKKSAKDAEMSNKRSSESYRTYTRQACNFVFPYIDGKINGENRPRPYQFRISEYDGQKLEEGNVAMNDIMAKYKNVLSSFLSEVERYFDDLNKHDEKSGLTIKDDIETFKTKYHGNYDKFKQESGNKSSLFAEFIKCSEKMTRIIFNIAMSKGPALVYSNYILMEGFEIFKLYLKYFGYAKFTKSNKYFGYAEFSGDIDAKERTQVMQIFKNEANKYGELAKIILISPAGSEGLSLSNMRQVHIMEPYWHETRIVQMIGRAIRLCSHKSLPLEERVVDVYRYKSIRKNHEQTTDEYIETLARNKEFLIQSFLNSLKEIAIDCDLFANHNKMLSTYKCFQFNQNSLFDTIIGPAYKQDMKDDLKMTNGLNSVNSVVIRTKVVKISAVIEIDKDRYGNPVSYWYDADKKVVYDIDLHYPVGKVKMEDGVPMIKNTHFVIDKVIPIPMIL
jgi:superfamily II DNA or RNA helicase